ncbi:hypothetical protein [Amycolatopsis thermophila]|uniref:Uncharacterized protein n=1 Tax=Amycolatopsis thermophila TaxID=206084 RepID=A0ABU0F5Z2_9PSEU|nr:hypothetical protein [Amycolatopsis thermophila]MDQ0382447.1 hypothetical protein [Amycolatopsis thermophila]
MAIVPVSQRVRDDAHLSNAALDIHADDLADGYRFIAAELARRGFTASKARVWRICSMRQIFDVGGLEPFLDRVGPRPRRSGAALAVDLCLQARHDFLRPAVCGLVGPTEVALTGWLMT